MALNKGALEKDLFNTLQKANEMGHDATTANKIIAKGFAAAIDKFIRGGDVEVDTDTPNLKILPGISTPLGSTIAPGSPVPMTTRGKHVGKGGKVV